MSSGLGLCLEVGNAITGCRTVDGFFASSRAWFAREFPPILVGRFFGNAAFSLANISAYFKLWLFSHCLALLMISVPLMVPSRARKQFEL
jgi:hypothetical protein